MRPRNAGEGVGGAGGHVKGHRSSSAARSAGGRASASTSASGADARSAARRRTRRCRPAWRSSRGQRMLLVRTCDLSHDPYATEQTQVSCATHITVQVSSQRRRRRSKRRRKCAARRSLGPGFRALGLARFHGRRCGSCQKRPAPSGTSVSRSHPASTSFIACFE